MEKHTKHTEEVQDIIGKPPHGLIRWGITWVLLVILAMVGLSAFIEYPDVVKTSIRIHSTHSPKVIISKVSGNLEKLLVPEKQKVKADQVIGWMESTADHQQVQNLGEALQQLRNQFHEVEVSPNTLSENLITPTQARLGELQNAYQSFYTQVMAFESTLKQGIYQKRRQYLLQEVQNVHRLRQQLDHQKRLQEEDFKLAEIEMNRYKNLADKKVISASEFEKQQSGFLAKQQPLQQTQTSLISNEGTLQARLKEISDLDHQVQEEKSKFMQSLNSMMSQIDDWKKQYLLTANLEGTLIYAGILEENQFINTGQELFYINPGSSGFFGEIKVPQYNLGKVRDGQQVLVKLDSYPFEEFGVIKGKISHFNSVPVLDSVFLARVEWEDVSLDPRVQLRPGLSGSSEIVTEDASLLSRLYRNVMRVMR